MELSLSTSYALRALANLAQSPRGPAPLGAIAQAAGAPEHFLPTVLHLLTQAGILAVREGPKGGYRLARPAHRITLLEVVEAVESPIRGEAPPTEGKTDEAVLERINEVCERVARQTRRKLGRVTIAELAGKRR
jgi:Rrf2 family protein